MKRAQFFACFLTSVVWIGFRSGHRINTSSGPDTVRRFDINHSSNLSLALGDATIVTAYFEFPSKHTHAEYTEWMQNMLSLQDPMVIFTTLDKQAMIYRMRKHALNQTLVVVTQLEDTEVVRSYGMEFWTSQHNQDPWHAIHPDPRIYVVWNEKISFVHKSIALNPFASSHFIWMDIGFLRHNLYNSRRLITDATPFAEDRVLTLDITAMSANFFYDRFTVNENRLCGNLFGGTTVAMETYHSEYQKTLAMDIAMSQFVGVDQIEMWRTCQRVPTLCNIVKVNPRCGEMWRTCYRVQNQVHRVVNWSFITNNPDDQDPWFSMVPFLLGMTRLHND